MFSGGGFNNFYAINIVIYLHYSETYRIMLTNYVKYLIGLFQNSYKFQIDLVSPFESEQDMLIMPQPILWLPSPYNLESRSRIGSAELVNSVPRSSTSG